MNDFFKREAMILKSIKLAGFKSFADPTTIPIRGNMNAIVGPNGCGKSNVIDAIRWVIGETSAKQLRGQSMADVIFNGTSSRQPVGKALVELNFDNTAGRIVGEYAKYSELVIRREVERNGQSNYFLNNTHCRRRDILDIFLGTGMGPRSYSIIEQGMVSKLVEAKPEELRVFLEEAAGISKYKERRRETENRIRHTRENLDRLVDLLGELEKQQRHLKRQANAAERFKVLKAEERVMLGQIKALQWQEMKDKSSGQDERIAELEIDYERLQAQLREYETELEKGRIAQHELSDNHNEVQKRYYGLGAEIARLEQQIQSTQEQTKNWQSELDDADSLWAEVSENSSEQHEQLENISAEVAQLSPQQDSRDSALAQTQRTLSDADARMNEWQSAWDSVQTELSGHMRQAEVARTQIRHYQQQLTQAEQRLEQLSSRREQMQLTELESELAPLAERVAMLEQELMQVTEQRESVKIQLQESKQNNQYQNQQLQQRRRELAQLEAQFTSLEAIQKAALASDDETINEWLNQAQLQDRPRLGKELTVSPGWELAAETVLTDYFDAICVDSVANLTSSAVDISAGHMTLVEKSALPTQQADSKAETLAAKISSDWPIAAWLNGIYVADNLEQARALSTQLAANESVITRDGIWLGPNWLRIAKAADSENSVLFREQQLTQLQAQITEAAEILAEQEQLVAQGEATLADLELQRETLQNTQQSLSDQHSTAKTDLSVTQSRLAQEQQQLQRLEQEIQECNTRKSEAESLLDDSQSELMMAESQAGDLTARRDELQRQRQQLVDALNAAREQAQEAKQRADELSIRLTSNENQLHLLQQTLSHAQRQMEQLEARRTTLREQLQDVDGPLQRLDAQLQTELNQRLTIETELRAVEATLEQHNQRLNELETQRQQTQQQQSEMQQLIGELKMQRQEITVRQTTIIEQLTEADFQLETLLNEMPEEASLNEWELRAEKVAQRILRIGPINLAAIDEHAAVTERKEHLDKQLEDLNEALEVLQSAIRKIDRETKTKFKDTFDRVNAKFQEVFPRIFGGGKALLELTDEDLLTAGVMVKAQPPGKRNTTIHMLSGGEKALTAISLVFSLFSLNPAPFCILDEVDAPLDDLNVGRFCTLVKEMSENTQFMVISHNKVTIEAADHLMGVTMQEAGVSRLVSVDIAEAIEMVEA